MASCNGCDLARLKEKHGNKLRKIHGSWYLVGESPGDGQEHVEYQGLPIKFMAWYMSETHCH